MTAADGRVVFLDRDGVINTRYPPYVDRWEDLVLYPWSLQALRLLSGQSDYLFLMTNQSGVERGKFTEEELQRLLTRMHERFAESGISFTELYYCPHHPGSGCGCRKPDPGMLTRAADRYQLDLNSAWVVGDKDVDVLAGAAVGAHTILLKNRGKVDAELSPAQPTAVRANLLEAAKTIVGSWEDRS